MTNICELYKANYQNGDTIEKSVGLQQMCELCDNALSDPILLPCLHIFDKGCILAMESQKIEFNHIKCPKCDLKSSLSSFKSLNKCFILNAEMADIEDEASEGGIKCILCTTGDNGTYKCPDCAGIICERCRNLHKEVVIFQSHTSVQALSPKDRDNINEVVKYLGDNKPAKCTLHKEESLDSFCFKCYVALCSKCGVLDHKSHEIIPLSDFFNTISDELNDLLSKCKLTQNKVNERIEQWNGSLSDVTKSRDLNKTRIEASFDIWRSVMEQLKAEMLTMNKNLHDNLEYQIMTQIHEDQKKSDYIEHVVDFVNTYVKKCTVLEAVKLIKPTLDCLSNLANFKSDLSPVVASVPLTLPDEEMIKTCLRSNIGSFPTMNSFTNVNSSGVFHENGLFQSPSYRANDQSIMSIVSTEASDNISMYSPINTNYDEPELLQNKENSLFNCKFSQMSGTSNCRLVSNHSFTGLDNVSHSANLPLSLIHQTSNEFYSFSNDMSPLLNSKGSVASGNDSTQFIPPFYDDPTIASPIMSRMGTEFPVDGTQVNVNQNFGGNLYRPIVNLNPVPKPPFPSRNRNYMPMVIKERWGSQGSNRGQLNSPHGFCLGFSEEIVVADTQNHRIQIFSKDGQFINQFGIAGREEGHLWHPRKVTIIRNTQHYVVCDRGSERSRMQIFAKNGYFIRKIAIPYIDIVAGLAINNQGHIVAVDSVSPTIFVVTEMGEMVKWIECSSQMREPSDIVVHGENYYICDFKGHCVCVYKQDGTFLFRFGNEKITNYPNGIDVSNHGDILVGDSHGNRFHVAVFTKDGHLTGEFECPSVKVSRACGLKITSEGYLVTLAKNNHNVLVIDTLYVN